VTTYWYETQERAFAPGIADGWPKVIAAPHTPNGRLVRRDGDPSELLAIVRRVAEHFADTDAPLGAAARAAIAKAEGRER
jgi:hypothetical protein